MTSPGVTPSPEARRRRRRRWVVPSASVVDSSSEPSESFSSESSWPDAPSCPFGLRRPRPPRRRRRLRAERLSESESESDALADESDSLEESLELLAASSFTGALFAVALRALGALLSTSGA